MAENQVPSAEHILVCGGAGYIGSHMVARLRREGFRVTVFDNLSTGHREAIEDAELIVGDVLDSSDLDRLFRGAHFDAVMHFCARSLVGESVREPQAYYRNNVVGTLNLLEAMLHAGVGKLVFSSSAAVYGMPRLSPTDESQPIQPINPYGASKAMVERVLADAALAHGMRSVSLRYFNAAGADSSGRIGESHTPETHLIPNLLRAARNGGTVQIFGNDYDTRDGTCMRDYVHVDDLAEAHLRAFDYMRQRDGAHCFNLGNGNGFSVREVVEAARRVTGRNIRTAIAPRRAGDPPILVAASASASAMLGWHPQYGNVDDIIETAWRWHRAPRY